VRHVLNPRPADLAELGKVQRWTHAKCHVAQLGRYC